MPLVKSSAAIRLDVLLGSIIFELLDGISLVVILTGAGHFLTEMLAYNCGTFGNEFLPAL